MQPVALSGLMHELPYSRGTGPRQGGRVERRLDYCHILEFLRKAVPAEGFLEYGHVVACEAEHLRHLGRHLLGVEYDVVPDGLVVGKGYEGIHLLEPCLVNAVGNVGSEVDGLKVIAFALVVASCKVLHIPEVEQTVAGLQCIFLRVQAGSGLAAVPLRKFLQPPVAGCLLFEFKPVFLDHVQKGVDELVFLPGHPLGFLLPCPGQGEFLFSRICLCRHVRCCGERAEHQARQYGLDSPVHQNSGRLESESQPQAETLAVRARIPRPAPRRERILVI